MQLTGNSNTINPVKSITNYDYETKLNELNGEIQPIMMKAMGQQGFPGSEGLSTNEAVPPSTDGENSGPTIDEVD